MSEYSEQSEGSRRDEEMVVKQKSSSKEQCREGVDGMKNICKEKKEEEHGKKGKE